jgi:catechol 2,3-dioxygenase
MEAPPDPEQLEATGVEATADLSPATTVGEVHLTVSDLDRSIAYYTRAIGLELLDRGGNRAIFGAGEKGLVVVVEDPGARGVGRVGRHTGLYHFALLVPERPDLARWLAHAARDRVPLVGLSDHFVSEALYLSDPDGHGIEIYRDRPRAGWEGQVARMTTLRLDVDDLLAELEDPAAEPFDGLPAGTVMGHIHLKVAAIPPTVAFYRDVIGFGLMAELGGQAAFLSAGGYHHHLGSNTWESAGASPPRPGTASLRHATIVLPDAGQRDGVLGRVQDSGQTPEDTPDGPLIRDPSGNRLVIALAG